MSGKDGWFSYLNQAIQVDLPKADIASLAKANSFSS